MVASGTCLRKNSNVIVSTRVRNCILRITDVVLLFLSHCHVIIDAFPSMKMVFSVLIKLRSIFLSHPRLLSNPSNNSASFLVITYQSENNTGGDYGIVLRPQEAQKSTWNSRFIKRWLSQNWCRVHLHIFYCLSHNLCFERWSCSPGIAACWVTFNADGSREIADFVISWTAESNEMFVGRRRIFRN